MPRNTLYGLTPQEQAVLSRKDPSRYRERSFQRYRYFYYQPIRFTKCPKHIPNAPSAGACMKCDKGVQERKVGPTGKLWFGDFKCGVPTQIAGKKKVYIDPEDVPRHKAEGKTILSEEVRY